MQTRERVCGTGGPHNWNTIAHESGRLGRFGTVCPAADRNPCGDNHRDCFGQSAKKGEKAAEYVNLAAYTSRRHVVACEHL